MSTLKEEIQKTVEWFAECDVKNIGHVSKNTLEIAKVQDVELNMVRPNNVQDLVAALVAAQKAADEADPIEDGGTCNNDSPVIKLKRWKQENIEEVSLLTGIRIGDQLSNWLWKGYRFIDFKVKGQANRRSRMAEAAYKVLKERGCDVVLYQQAN